MNNFHTELKSLMAIAQIKNATLAQAVQYDESYVSKWLSGRALPSEKNIEKIAGRIADCILKEAPQDSKAQLLARYGAEADDSLALVLQEALLSAYRGEEVTESLTFQESEQLLNLVRELDVSGDTFLVADLFAMDHESRLLLAGIKDGSFLGQRKGKVRYLLSLSSKNDAIYDPIYLVHLLTAGSGADFSLYGSTLAAGKLLYSDTKKKAVSAFLADGGYCMAITRKEEAESAKKLANMLGSLCTQERLLFGKLPDLLSNHFYMNTLLSANFSWLLGHFTEQMVPEAVFDILAQTDEEKRIKEMLLQRAPKAKFLLYRAAFSKLIISGQVDFFGKSVSLSKDAQAACIRYVYDLAKQGDVRIIEEGFSTDFRFVTDPCVFLSDTTGYLRLENGTEENHLLQIQDKDCRQMYLDFFMKAWALQDGTVVSDTAAVLQIIKTFMEQI